MPVLKARIGGTWVDVGGGGADEVWVGPNTPTDANNELWIDTDEADLTDPNVARWNSAWGIVASAVSVTITNGGVNNVPTDTGVSISWTALAGRNYVVEAACCRVNASAGQNLNVFWTDAANTIIDYLVIGGGVVGDQQIDGWTPRVGTGLQTIKLRAASTGAVAPVFQAGGYPSSIKVTDVGPVSLASNPPAQPASVWTNMTLINGWTNYNSGFGPAQYRKVGDVVELRGLVAHVASIANTSNLATLPSGFRPPAPSINAAYTVGVSITGMARFDVQTDGNLTFVMQPQGQPAGSFVDYMALDGIRFSVTA